MALALEQYAVINLTLRDSLGKDTTRTVEMDIGTTATDTIDDLVAAATTFWTELDPLTNSALVNLQVAINYREQAVIVPGAGLNADVAELSLPLENRPNRYGGFDVPSPASGIFVASSGQNANIVDPADADVIAFMTLFAPSGAFYTSDREHTIAFDDDQFRGKRAQRRSR